MNWNIPKINRTETSLLLNDLVAWYTAPGYSEVIRNAYLDAHEEIVVQWGATTGQFLDYVAAYIGDFETYSKNWQYQDAFQQYLELPPQE
jgi:hypothetical protein